MKFTFNGKPQVVDDRTTVAQILERFEIDRRHVAIEVNLDIVPRAELDTYVIHEGDRVEAVTLVGGG